jgi:hypothetical protein
MHKLVRLVAAAPARHDSLALFDLASELGPLPPSAWIHLAAR